MPGDAAEWDRKWLTRRPGDLVVGEVPHQSLCIETELCSHRAFRHFGRVSPQPPDGTAKHREEDVARHCSSWSPSVSVRVEQTLLESSTDQVEHLVPSRGQLCQLDLTVGTQCNGGSSGPELREVFAESSRTLVSVPRGWRE